MAELQENLSGGVLKVSEYIQKQIEKMSRRQLSKEIDRLQTNLTELKYEPEERVFIEKNINLFKRELERKEEYSKKRWREQK